MHDRQNGKIIWFMSPLHPRNKTNHWNPILYCWWLKSCTTWDVWNPINTGINYQPQLVSRSSAMIPISYRLSSTRNDVWKHGFSKERSLKPWLVYPEWVGGSSECGDDWDAVGWWKCYVFVIYIYIYVFSFIQARYWCIPKIFHVM